MTDLKQELIAEADQYCSVAKISRARLATLVANDGKFFDRIQGGGGLTIRMYERFKKFFAENPAEKRASAQKPAGEAA